MSKKEDDDKVKMSQCEKKSIVVQGIKDRSKMRNHKVVEKQGGVEMNVMQGKQEKGSKERPRDGCLWDEGEIHRSRGFGVQECWERENRVEG